MGIWTERLKKYQNHVFIGAAVLAWAMTFKFGFASSEWTGFWSSSAPLRGSTIPIREREVMSEAERRKRMAKPNSALKDEIDSAKADMKKDLLGDRSTTRGFDPERRGRPSVPSDVRSYTQRDACFQMKLEHPERYGDVDCMSSAYDDVDPWWQAPKGRAK